MERNVRDERIMSHMKIKQCPSLSPPLYVKRERGMKSRKMGEEREITSI